MALHAINQFTFEFWRGDPPRHVIAGVETFTRAGTKGTAAKLIGKRGTPFTAELEAWTQTWFNARALLAGYESLIGANPVRVIWNELDQLALYRTSYLVTDVQEVDCQSNIRLLGPGIDYSAGVALVTRWQMTPIYMG